MVTVTRSAELEEWGREGSRRLAAGDIAWFEQSTGYGDVALFGTATEERLIGREALLAPTRIEIDVLNGIVGSDVVAAGVDEDEVEAYQAGNVGWIVTHGRFTHEDGSWTANRQLIVLVRDPEDGGWKTVLTTSQVLVPNDLLLPGSPLRIPAES
jgi:hypothetical protein